MPYVIVNGPKIEKIDVKRILVKGITDSLEKAYELPRYTYTVLIHEDSPEYLGVGGELFIERDKK